ncbi:Mu transposase C-terminal domain-containing protein [Hydrogenophaga sp. PAMC20947]|uniref:Mu transposase C-terminal domain-containing protein n=1 Tax=Hydrogenophaga sp. PAMC20947 TaxID=2565558 RepID=UPI00109D9792|nr:Mu transposase C-terminal domain-containing protein [Hydrogenophaga sp. PAMC20947]QCB47671.1 integrase [Hydrogenophaga sp. PAMC20947]
MAGFGLRKNMVFDWKGATFRIDRLLPNGEMLLEAGNGGAISLVPRQVLLDDFTRGLVSTSTVIDPQSSAMPIYGRPLDQLPDGVQQELKRRRKYLEAIHADGKPIFTPEFLLPIIQRVAKENFDTNAPSATTVYRWNKRLASGSDTRALLPRYDLRGSKRGRQSKRLNELLAEATEAAFNTTPLATVTNIYSRFLAKIDLENRQTLSSKPLVTPSKRTVYRMLGDVDIYDMTALKEGKASADRRFRVGKAGVRSTRILERVEIDHTPLDLFLVDERTWLPLGRPTLTVAIDHFSRMPLGYYLSYGSPSAAAVVGALRHGILPKAEAEIAIADLPVENRWPTYGIPESLVVDNGLEFHGLDLEGIAFDLGIHTSFCPKHQPRFKGSIERFLGTFNRQFAHQLPGTSFSRFHLRGDYDPQKSALLTLGEFKHLLEKWVVDIYAQTKHSGIGTTPWQRWHEGLAAFEPRLPSDLQMLQRRIGQSASRKLRRDGFELNGIRYNGDTLSQVLRQYGEGVEIRVVFDPEDLGEVHVWGPLESDPITVEALDLTYARGMTLRQNALIRQVLREEGAKAEDRVALQRARNDITKAVEELMVSRKQKARQRSGAIRGISSSKPNGTPTPQSQSAESPVIRKLKSIKPTGKAPATDLELPKVLEAFQMNPNKRGRDGNS